LSFWYLLHETTPRTAAENMAVDEHLLELVSGGRLARPVLRTYSWEKPTLSLGYHQQWRKTCDLDALHRHDIDLVRRWTGGRGVLHDSGEITYAVIAPTTPPFEDRVTHNYRLIGEALARFTFLEASPAQMSDRAESRESIRGKRHLPCFASISTAEIEKAGRKLIGSSQKLGDGAFLQHGSIPIIHRTEVLEEITVTPEPMAGYMTSLTDHYAAANLPLPDRATLLDELTHAFAETFAIDFRRLSSEGFPDAGRVDDLVRTRYATEAWTFRK